jgi:hypothetical protein
MRSTAVNFGSATSNIFYWKISRILYKAFLAGGGAVASRRSIAAMVGKNALLYVEFAIIHGTLRAHSLETARDFACASLISYIVS